jgi:hypothetical protein
MKDAPPPCEHRTLVTRDGKRVCAACLRRIYL